MIKKLTFILFFLFIMAFIVINSFIKFFPLPYYNEITAISKKYNIQKDVIYSVIKIESDFRETVVSHRGAMGLMQIMPSTGKGIAKSNSLPYTKELLLDPIYNIQIGTLYLSTLSKRYNGHIDDILVAYNAGPSRLRDGSWKDFKETKNYIIKYKIVNFFYKLKLSMKFL